MRYYSTQRPLGPGCFPKPEGNTVEQVANFPAKTYVEEIHGQAWGFVDYAKPLTYYDVLNYELTAVLTSARRLKYIGRDSWGRFVYEDENGRLWKHTDCCALREICEERGDRPYSASNNAFDGEPDYPMPPHVKIVYLKDGEEF